MKRRVRECIKARQFNPNIGEFAEIACKVCPNINIIFISSNSIKIKIPTLDKKWCPNGQEVCSIPGTRKYHYFKAHNQYEILYSTITDFSTCGLKKFSFIIGKHEEFHNI